MDFLSYDEGWFDGIPGDLTGNRSHTLKTRLHEAYKFSASTPLAQENTQKALAVLVRFGLVVERASSPEQSSVPLGKYIVDSLLNYSLERGRPCEHGFFLRLSSSGASDHDEIEALRIPARSHLLLLALAYRLGITIYVFSSRSKSRIFEPRDATTEYSVGLFYNVDSYHGIGEYLVLASSTHLLDPSGVPVTPSINAYINPIPVAVFRESKGRSAAKRRRIETEMLTRDDCVSCFDTACATAMKRAIEAEVARVKVKRLPSNTTREALFEASRDPFKADLLARKRLVKGTMEMAADNVKKEHSHNQGFSVGDLQAILGPQKNNIGMWKEVVSKEFSAIWGREVEKNSKGKGKRLTSASRASSAAPSVSSLASSLNRKMDIEEEANLGETDMDVDGDGDDDDDNDDDEEKDKKKTRVCTTTIKKILRPDFLDVAGNHVNFLRIAEEKQRNLTDIVSEISVLSRKVVNVVSNMMLYYVISAVEKDRPLIMFTLPDCERGAIPRPRAPRFSGRGRNHI